MLCVCGHALSAVRLFMTLQTVVARLLCPWDSLLRWSGLPFPPPEDLPNPSIEIKSPMSPALADRFITTEPPGISGLQNVFEQVSPSLSFILPSIPRSFPPVSCNHSLRSWILDHKGRLQGRALRLSTVATRWHSYCAGKRTLHSTLHTEPYPMPPNFQWKEFSVRGTFSSAHAAAV